MQQAPLLPPHSLVQAAADDDAGAHEAMPPAADMSVLGTPSQDAGNSNAEAAAGSNGAGSAGAVRRAEGQLVLGEVTPTTPGPST